MNILTAVITSFAAALALLFTFIPKLLGFLVILLIGWIVATALSKAVTFLLRKVGFDRIGDRIGLSRLLTQSGIKTDAADVLGKLVYWFVFLIFLVPAVDALGLTAVSNLLGQVIGFLTQCVRCYSHSLPGYVRRNHCRRPIVRGADWECEELAMRTSWRMSLATPSWVLSL